MDPPAAHETTERGCTAAHPPIRTPCADADRMTFPNKAHPMFTSFVEMFRGRQEEAAETIAELVRRVVDGERVSPDELFRAATDAGMKPEDVDAMADRMRNRDRLRMVAMNADGAAAEMAKLAEAIGKHDATLAEAQRRHEIAVAPIRDQLTAAQNRHTEAMNAESDLLHPRNMEPAIHERLVDAQAEHHAAAAAVDAIRLEEHEQTKRAEHAGRVMVDKKLDASKLEELWRNESTRHKISSADERVFLDWLRGNRRAKEAAEKLPAALVVLEAAQSRVSEILMEARAS